MTVPAPFSHPDPHSPPVYRIIGLFLSVALVAVASSRGEEASPDEVDFVRQIRPILSENCAFCHGPDPATREADLRLDTADGLSSVIEPNSSTDSDLFRRIVSDDESERMPPPESNRSLAPAQIDTIRRWINQGAKWDRHWSFRPIMRPDLPTLAAHSPAPIHNAIDLFVQHKLAELSIDPSPQADRTTLIRRLSLDLTGLPPTPEQVDEFLADPQPDAYQHLVDRILESPAFGQRMAWDWLDAARYADSNGYQGDRERTMWPWRDWVVRAFNENLPYDQFTLWQLAGDLLPDATHEQKLATGFCRNHMINGEGGRIAEENRVEYVMDMSETMGTVWLGLTLNCCRCHDHKYDPLTNKEYYQFFSFFNQTPVQGNGGDPQTPPILAAPTEDAAEEIDAIKDQIALLDSQMKIVSQRLSATQADWEAAELDRLSGSTQWQSLQPIKVFASGAKLRLLKDHSVLAAGKNPDNDTYTFTASTSLKRVTGLRIEALQHESMTNNGLARSNSGNFVLTGIEINRIDGNQSQPIKISSAQATFEQGSNLIKNAFDDDPQSGWAVYEGHSFDRGHAAVFKFEQPIVVNSDSVFEFILRHDSVHKQHNLGRFRLSLTDHIDPQLSSASDRLLTALKVEPGERDEDQNRLLSRSHRESNAEYKSLQDRREQLTKRRDDLEKAFPKVMVMADMEEPRQTFMLERGLYNKPTEQVSAKLPAFLPAPPDPTPANRLTLARWLVSEQNPLMARVTVNRFWQQLFGIGLVKTTEDFGSQGEIPIHMNLLNWLAVEFRESGWDVKQLMRLIVTSHTYRQTSQISDPSLYERDPDNRLLARGARYRMPAWMLRDQALAVSGLLSSVVGGPAVNTYQPAGVWEEASFGKKTYQRDSGGQLYRRSLYTFWRRIVAPTMFFDNASRQTCTVKSSRTNTPLQALQTLNNVAYVEAARSLAQLALQTDVESDPDRLDFVMRRTLARPASPAESEIFLAGLQRTRDQFAGSKQDAEELIAIGESPRDQSLDAIEHASWTALCLAILNLDETLTRE